MKVETVSSANRWLEMFDKLTALLFLVDVSEYDCLVEEDGQVKCGIYGTHRPTLFKDSTPISLSMQIILCCRMRHH